MSTLQQTIEQAWEDRNLLTQPAVKDAVFQVVELLDKGEIRVAEPTADGNWKVNDWVKKGVVMYFPLRQMETIEVGPFEFHDKIPLKKSYAALGVGCTARHCPLRVLPGKGGYPDAQLCQYWRLGRQWHHGGYLGHGRLLCPDWPQCTPQWRGWYWWRIGASSGFTHHH
nr:hypothetical protein [Haliscomenobacter sp.]